MTSELLKAGEQLSDIINHSKILDTHFTDAFKTFTDILENGGRDVLNKTIETKVSSGGTTSYKTTLEINGNVTNEFPASQPPDNDVYWKRHNELVNDVLNTRKEIILKVIETCGNTVKGIINPISITSL